MNSRTSFVLFVLATVVTLGMSSAHAAEHDESPPNEISVDEALSNARMQAEETLLREIPVSVWTEMEEYDQDDVIMVEGMVAYTSANPVLLTVTNPLNSIVEIRQVEVADDRSWSAEFNVKGNQWKYDGTYIISVDYAGSSNEIRIGVAGGIEFPRLTTSDACIVPDNLTKPHKDECIPYTITNGVVTGASINLKDTSIVVSIESDDDGTLTLSPSKEIISNVFMVLVDGEEWDDAEVAEDITVMFPAGTQEIELLAGFVIPEFGTIAVMVLAVAIVTIVVMSARSGLSIVPRY